MDSAENRFLQCGSKIEERGRYDLMMLILSELSKMKDKDKERVIEKAEALNDSRRS